MYVYADESGHTGRDVFAEPKYFWEGSILSEVELEPLFEPLVTEYCVKNKLDRIHAHKMKMGDVIDLSYKLLEVIARINWEFQCCLLEKNYIPPTKFVDTFFDHAENDAVPSEWYNQTGKRHILCLAFDKILTDDNKVRFWNSFLKNDRGDLKLSLQNAKNYLARYVKERTELYDVLLEGMRWADINIDAFTIDTTKTRHSYKMQCPNFIAFTALYGKIHEFAEKYHSPIEKIIHDRSSEFKKDDGGGTHFLGEGKFVERWFGYPPLWEPADYTSGDLIFESSKENSALQVVDLFTWVMQKKDDELTEVKNMLHEKGDVFLVTRDLTFAQCFIHAKEELASQFKRKIVSV